MRFFVLERAIVLKLEIVIHFDFECFKTFIVLVRKKVNWYIMFDFITFTRATVI